MSGKIEKELLKATGIKPKDGEAPAKFRARLVRAVSELPDDDWAALSEEAQEWTNAGVKALKEKKEVQGFDGGDDDAPAKKPAAKKPAPKASKDEDEDEAPADDEDDEKPADDDDPPADDEDEDDEKPADEDEEDPPAKKPAAKKPAPKPEKAKADDDDDEAPAEKAPAKKPAADGKRGGSAKFRELVIKHPDWEKAKLLEKVNELGFILSKSTAEITYYETKSTLKVLDDLGIDIRAALAAAKKAK